LGFQRFQERNVLICCELAALIGVHDSGLTETVDGKFQRLYDQGSLQLNLTA